MNPYVYYEYYNFDGADFFTVILKPDKVGRYPVVVTRSPYVRDTKEKSEDELAKNFLREHIAWAENNYVIILQHCRGQGKSSGDFIPYVHEREDGLALREWIRKQDFYNGQMLLLGGSYTASLHYSTAPFENDIIGAVFNVQDSERYRLWYRNGCMRRGHAGWHFGLYKDKSNLKKNLTSESFSELPLENLSERVLGERAVDFEEMLLAPHIEHPFWQSRNGGSEARGAVTSANIPILLTTGYNDFYLGGMFRMWNEMEEQTREKCALIVSPYNHGDGFYSERGIRFPNASVSEQFGEDYRLRWFNSILENKKPFVETGKITYYRAFENKWGVDFYSGETEDVIIPLGDNTKVIEYDPQNPTAFCPEGCFMDEPYKRDDIISIYTQRFERDTVIRGRMRAQLAVASDCDDTSFYIMVGIETERGDYSLRHDITSILYQNGDYINGSTVVLNFEFDEYAFLVAKGQRLRIDIAPTDKCTYVSHTNVRGEYSRIGFSKTAQNKVLLDESYLILPVEK